MKEDLIELARIRAIRESICGFLLDEVINPNGEFYADPRISMGRVDPTRSEQLVLFTILWEKNVCAWLVVNTF